MPWWINGVLLAGTITAALLAAALAPAYGLDGVAAAVGAAQVAVCVIVIMRFLRWREET